MPLFSRVARLLGRCARRSRRSSTTSAPHSSSTTTTTTTTAAADSTPQADEARLADDTMAQHFRDGPALAKFEKVANVAGSNVQIDDDGYGVRNQSNQVECVVGNVKVYTGTWYFEVTAENDNNMHVGWVTPKFRFSPKNSNDHIGHDQYSWGYSGRKGWHKGSEITFGTSDSNFSSGQVVGCLLDCDKKEVSYYVDGKLIGICFKDINPADGLLPAVSLARYQRCRANFGKDSFTHPVDGALRLHSTLGPDGLRKVQKMFDKYHSDGVRGGDDRAIAALQPAAFDKLAAEAKLDMETVDFLMMSWIFHTSTLYQISLHEFLGGCDLHHITDARELGQCVTKFKRSFTTPDAMLDFYMFCFTSSLETNLKVLGIESAIATWSLVLKGHMELLDEFIEYLGQQKEHQKVTRDTWKQVMYFGFKVKKNLDGYDLNEYWPSIIDTFMEWLENKRKH